MVVLTTGALAIAPMMQFRPQLFDFIALSALLLLLARDSYRRAGLLWLAIPIFVLWANLHGGFFVGLARSRPILLRPQSRIWRPARALAARGIWVA